MMKITKASLGIFIVAFLVLVITNIIILSGVSSNRSDEPTSHTILTQRELPFSLGHFSKDNNGIFLKFVYRKYTENTDSSSLDWLNEEKLKKLGFDTERSKNAKYQKLFLTKEVFIVLENDGDAYQESLKRVEEKLRQEERLYNEDINNKNREGMYKYAKTLLLNEQHTNSRLFAIDAGLSYEKLRQKYDNIKKYIIVRGVIRSYYIRGIDKLYVNIQKLSIQKIHIPLKHSKWLRELSDKIKKQIAVYGYRNFNKSPEYQVELKYGKRYEPWVVSVDKIE